MQMRVLSEQEHLRREHEHLHVADEAERSDLLLVLLLLNHCYKLDYVQTIRLFRLFSKSIMVKQTHSSFENHYVAYRPGPQYDQLLRAAHQPRFISTSDQAQPFHQYSDSQGQEDLQLQQGQQQLENAHVKVDAKRLQDQLKQLMSQKNVKINQSAHLQDLIKAKTTRLQITVLEYLDEAISLAVNDFKPIPQQHSSPECIQSILKNLQLSLQLIDRVGSANNIRSKAVQTLADSTQLNSCSQLFVDQVAPLFSKWADKSTHLNSSLLRLSSGPHLQAQKAIQNLQRLKEKYWPFTWKCKQPRLKRVSRGVTKEVDRRASKNRKIRHESQSKLVNFCGGVGFREQLQCREQLMSQLRGERGEERWQEQGVELI